MRRLSTSLAIVCLSFLQPAGAWGQDTVLKHRDFSINIEKLATTSNREAIIASLRQQIDLVAAVDVPPDVMAFFRSVPVVIEPAEPGAPVTRQSGSYSGDTKTIRVGPIVMAPNPILLHEFIHAYHDQRLPNGNMNPEIWAMLRAVKASGAYPADAYMLEWATEYFAMSASVFLHGKAARDPLTRENIRQKDPAMFKYLEGLFGTRPLAPPTQPN